MNKHLPITVFFLLGSMVMSFGQQSAKRTIAEKYFGYMDYAKALPIYNELANRAVKDAAKGKSADWESVRRAAISNYHVRNYKKASNWYSALDKNKTATKDDYIMYFESLRYQGLYDEAEKYLQLLKQTDSMQKKVDAYSRELNYYKKLMADSGQYKVNELPFNKGLGDFGPAFYDKGLVYASSRANTNIGRRYGWDNSFFLNSYYSEKSGDSFKKSGKLQRKGFKTQPHDGPVYFAKDSKHAYITRNRTEKDVRKGDVVKLGLYTSEKGVGKGKKEKWGVPQPFQYNDKAYSIGHAALSPDEKTLYFASDMPGGQGGVDIWKSVREAGGWSKPVNLGSEINSAGNDMFPYVSPEGHLYFASDGYVGLGGLDIYEARKAGGHFIKPVNMGSPVNTSADDFALIMEPGGKMGYFSSDRKDHIDHVYGVVMNRIVFTLEGIVKAQNDSMDIVPNALVTIKNKTTGDSLLVTADSTGKFYAPLNKECEYEVMAEKPKYILIEPTLVSTKGLTESKDLSTELALMPNHGNIPGKSLKNFNLVVLVLDCATKKPIANADLILKDMNTGIEKKVRTNELGELEVGRSGSDLPEIKELAVINTEYALEAATQGYLPAVKKVYFVIKGSETEGEIIKEICLEKFETSGENSKFELKDIYYDYDKATLRPLSMTQLDKAYDFLMLNPSIKVELSSHTDSRGSDSYNMSLSQRRAQSCVDYLVKVRGLPAARIVAKGYGETQLTNGCSNGKPCSEEDHQANRRTEIRILGVNK